MAGELDPFTLRPWRPEDRENVIRLIECCYAEYGQKIELDTLDSDLTDIDAVYPQAGGTFQVLLDGARLIGTVAVKSAEGRAELKRVFLESAYRRQGVGKKLSLWARGWAKQRGFDQLMIWSDVLYENAHRLYIGLGAVDTGRRRSLGGVNNADEFLFIWPTA